jgi:hypothetical protein
MSKKFTGRQARVAFFGASSHDSSGARLIGKETG